jgi:hypothetical protein
MRLSEATVSVTQTNDPVNARKGAKTSDGRETPLAAAFSQRDRNHAMGDQRTRCQPAAVTTKPGRDVVASSRAEFINASGSAGEANPILHLEYVNI